LQPQLQIKYPLKKLHFGKLKVQESSFCINKTAIIDFNTLVDFWEKKEELKMWKLLKIVFIAFLFKSTYAQMNQHQFDKHFVVKSSWSPPQWTKSAERYESQKG
jgi:hypothetical protein